MDLSLRSLLAATALLGAASLQAGSGDMRLGVQAGAAFPTNETRGLVDSKAGWFLGLHAAWEYRSGQVVRVRGDYTAFPANEKRADLKLKVAGVTGEWLTYVNGGSSQGLYLFGGLGVDQVDGSARAADAKQTKAAFAGGLGLNFTPTLALEVRGSSHFSVVDKLGSHVPMVQAGLTWQF